MAYADAVRLKQRRSQEVHSSTGRETKLISSPERGETSSTPSTSAENLKQRINTTFRESLRANTYGYTCFLLTYKCQRPPVSAQQLNG